MRNEFDAWKNSKLPPGQAWAQRGLAWAAAGTATAAVWLSVVLMAGLDLPAGASGQLASAPTTAPLAAAPLSAPLAAASVQPVASVEPVAAARSVRHAAMLPRVTITGKREPAQQEPAVAPVEVGAAPPRPASAGQTIGMTAAGDNLNQ